MVEYQDPNKFTLCTGASFSLDLMKQYIVINPGNHSSETYPIPNKMGKERFQ